jgi:hypothetical protein
VSLFLTIATPLEFITFSFTGRPTLMFTSALFSEFIVSVYSMDMASDRRRDVHDLLLRRGVGFVAALVLDHFVTAKSAAKCSLSTWIFWSTSTGSRGRYLRFFF